MTQVKDIINKYQYSTRVSTTFFSGPRSKCLDDPPRVALPGFTGTSVTGRELPGVVFDGDTQCEFLFGEGFRRCYQMRVSNTSYYNTFSVQ